MPVAIDLQGKQVQLYGSQKGNIEIWMRASVIDNDAKATVSFPPPCNLTLFILSTIMEIQPSN